MSATQSPTGKAGVGANNPPSDAAHHSESTPMNNTPLTWEGDRAPFAKAFIAAQMATEAVKKASTNPAFKSRYADLAVVVEAVIPALNESGIAVIQSPSFDGDLVSVTTVLLHESGSSVTGTLSMRPTKMDPQGVGSAITYARRYALLAMAGAAPEDDDGQAASQPGNDRAPTPPISQDQADALRLEIEAVGADPAKFLAFFKIKWLEAMPASRWNEAVAMLEAKRMKDAA
jgi:hypothetical protein